MADVQGGGELEDGVDAGGVAVPRSKKLLSPKRSPGFGFGLS